jgi:glutaredoxin-like protein NrdH
VTVTVLSKPACVQCTATYRTLDNEKVGYESDDIYTDGNLALVKELGYMAAPVVVVRDDEGNIADHWSGFRPDKITGLASTLKAA